MAEKIELLYDPFLLPTAQHRAGLAGLLVVVDTMRKRGFSPLPEITPDGEGRLRVVWEKESLASVFTELYESCEIELSSKTKRQGDPPKRIEETEDGKRYIYAQTVPKGSFLHALQIPEPHLKLWRDAIWTVIRDRDRSRGVYKESAGRQRAVEALWKQLLAYAKARASFAPPKSEEVSSALLLSAQAHNAELVAFAGMAPENLLLHFWPVVMGVYVPEVIERDGKRQFRGYVLTIPDVLRPEEFARDFQEMLASFSPEMAGFRPRDRVISLPEEGGLAYSEKLLAVAKAIEERDGQIAFSSMGIEVYHLDKRGQNVHFLHTSRIEVTPRILAQYENTKGFRSPLFRSRLIGNILERRPLYSGFCDLMSVSDSSLFIAGKSDEKQANYSRRVFQGDCQRFFKEVSHA